MSELTTEHMVKTVEHYMRCLREQDLDGICDMYSEDATVEDPVGSDTHNGSEQIRTFYSQAAGMKLQASLTGPVRCAANEAAFPFEILLPAEGGNMLMQVIDVFVFNDEGKVTSMRAFWGPENCVPQS